MNRCKIVHIPYDKRLFLLKIILLSFFIVMHLQAYESEDKLKVVIVGKIAKYVSFNNDDTNDFRITVLCDPCHKLFTSVYQDETINSKPVKIIYINDIKDLNQTNILYIPTLTNQKLSDTLKHSHNKNILTISDSRGFAQRGGMIQLYFVGQKLKLKINTQEVAKEGIKINPMLLRISDVVKGASE